MKKLQMLKDYDRKERRLLNRHVDRDQGPVTPAGRAPAGIRRR